MWKSKLAKIWNGIRLGLICLCVIGVCAGCAPHETNEPPAPYWPPGVSPFPRRETPMTVEDIRAMVQKEYFKEDGSIKWEIWNGAGSNLPEEEREAFLKQPITGLDVQIIKNEKGEEESFLVEFEPTGYALGSVWYERVGEFNIYPSPFKTLQVEKDNRYIFTLYPPQQVWACATMVDGELIRIDAVNRVRVSEYTKQLYAGFEIIEVYNFEKQKFDGEYPLRNGLWVTDEGYEPPLYDPEKRI